MTPHASSLLHGSHHIPKFDDALLPRDALFVRRISRPDELFLYDLEAPGYGIFRLDGDLCGFRTTQHAAFEWIRVEGCTPLWMH